MVVVPPWSDQGTSAKLIQDVWKTGVRVKHNEDGIVGSEEIKMCLDLVMGVKENRAEIGEENREEMRRINAKKWKDLAREAIEEGGSIPSDHTRSSDSVEFYIEWLNSKLKEIIVYVTFERHRFVGFWQSILVGHKRAMSKQQG
ncbi:UDP-glucuronosyl/UDP-glucosyltransferase [Parasponia andersonii]|uniref:UDP-glucuronosyl/UDP-glucosyltransferase n=1 Tax=Parasponia andersonii TaxID=3476 RepID=A0A2P5C3Y3_PARAD|nr:UDP-glucuronosyl/UDP-glucosyltransferase [Parasponia andersonii]